MLGVAFLIVTLNVIMESVVMLSVVVTLYELNKKQ